MKTDKQIRKDCKKNKVWGLFYPDGSSSLMNYNPIKHETDKLKIFKNKELKIKEWHQLIVKGLVNGLSYTAMDGRTDDINFWRKRCDLFDTFAHCIQSLITEQSYKYDEKNLKEIAEEGYKK